MGRTAAFHVACDGLICGEQTSNCRILCLVDTEPIPATAPQQAARPVVLAAFPRVARSGLGRAVEELGDELRYSLGFVFL
jgi:hypothetical protein